MLSERWCEEGGFYRQLMMIAALPVLMHFKNSCFHIGLHSLLQLCSADKFDKEIS